MNTILEKFFEAPAPPVKEEKSESQNSDAKGNDDLDKNDLDGEGDSVKLVEQLDPEKDLNDYLDDQQTDDKPAETAEKEDDAKDKDEE